MTTYTEQELRELDAWIAEHVLGWTPIVRGADSTYPKLSYWNMGNGYERLQQQFRPSTDPESAMQVLEKCRLSSVVEISSQRNPEAVAIKDANFGIRVTAETLPLAIALFAKQLFSK